MEDCCQCCRPRHRIRSKAQHRRLPRRSLAFSSRSSFGIFPSSFIFSLHFLLLPLLLLYSRTATGLIVVGPNGIVVGPNNHSSSTTTTTTTTTLWPPNIPTAGPIDDATCNIEELEMANDSQLHCILSDLVQTAFFRQFVVDLDHTCPLHQWATVTTGSPKSTKTTTTTSTSSAAAVGAAPPLPVISSSSSTSASSSAVVEDDNDPFDCPSSKSGEVDDHAEPLCSVDTTGGGGMMGSLDSNALTFLQAGGFQSQAQKETFAWQQHSDLVIEEPATDAVTEQCDDSTALLPDSFWVDMCSSIKTSSPGAVPVNLALNPERNTFYNGTHIWRAIYDENCIASDGGGGEGTGGGQGRCLEERVLYRLLSGLHTSTTLSIAVNYYPPSEKKGRVSWEPNPQFFMAKFEHHPEYLRNLHFSYLVLLRALGKAAPFLHNYEIRTGDIVEDETATVLLRRLLDSSILNSCASVFEAFDESLLWKGKDAKLQQNFKGVFHNVSSILDCVRCQQCKLHGKMAMLGYGAALKVLFMQHPTLERNEIVALINTLAKFSESLRHIRELTHLYWTSQLQLQQQQQQQQQQQHLQIPTFIPSTRNGTASSSPSWAASSPSAAPAAASPWSADDVDRAVQLVAGLGREGRLPWDRESELVRLALRRNDDLLVLARHYSTDAGKFLELVQLSIVGNSGSAQTSAAAVALPDAIVVGSGLAGLAATLNVLDRGGTVVVIEKEHLLGGNSNKASSGINGCCLPEDNTTDTLDLFRNDTTRSAGQSAQPELIEVLVGRSAEALHWLKDRVRVDLSLLSQLGGHSTKRTHRPSNGMAGAEIIYHLQKAVRSFEPTGRVKILVDTKVNSLLTDDSGRVIGVSTQSTKDGGTSEIRGDHVVLATGGFAADRSSGSYLDRYRPELLKMATTAGPFSTGDGVALATALGAGTVDMDKVQIHPTGWVDPTDPNSTSKVLAAELMRGVGGIVLNDQGERFCNELGTRAYVVDRMLAHNPSYAQSGKWDLQSPVPTFHLVLSSAAAADGKKHVDLYTHKGLMKEVKGVSQLAEHTALPKSSLIATLTQYREAAINGTDKFGKTSFRGLPQADLEAEVYFVGRITPVLHYCMGGITIDAEGHVLKESGEKIPGLRAAGEVTGGVHGVNRLGGNSLLECTVYGSMIGRSLPIKAPGPTTTSIAAQAQSSNSGQSELRTVALAELQEHNSPDDCWVAIHGIVYDLTDFADEHPAGSLSIHELAGTIGTEAFAAVHNKDVLVDFEDVRIGLLAES